MSLNLPPITKSKSVIVTGALSIFSLLYKAVDAAGNAEFVWQKLGVSENAANFLGSPRTIDFMVAVSLLGLVLSLLYQTNRNMATAGVASTEKGPQETSSLAPPPVEAAAERIVIDVAPEYLMRLCEGHTAVQAQKSVELFIGKWIRVSGIIYDVKPAQYWWVVTITLERGMASAYFRKTTERLSVLLRGDQITVMGEIETIDERNLGLEKCELIEAKQARGDESR